jgi:hypothetical protein
MAISGNCLCPDIDEEAQICIDPLKDGFHPNNFGRMALEYFSPGNTKGIR